MMPCKAAPMYSPPKPKLNSKNTTLVLTNYNMFEILEMN
jgi:hypothetical protein